MSTLPIAEFRDLDGSYVLVQPFDEVRCRVLASNVAAKGQVLHKDAKMSWEAAAKDLGGFTRLGPCHLLSHSDESTAHSDDYRVLLTGGPEPAPDHLTEFEDPRYSKNQAQAVDADPRVAILRLAIHYKTVHERLEGRTRWVNICRCDEYAPNGDVLKARLHAIVSLALLKKNIPSLPRIRGAIREVYRDRAKVA